MEILPAIPFPFWAYKIEEKDKIGIDTIADFISDIVVKISTTGVDFSGLSLEPLMFNPFVHKIVYIGINLIMGGRPYEHLSFIMEYETLTTLKLEHMSRLQIIELLFAKRLLDYVTEFTNTIESFLVLSNAVCSNSMQFKLEEKFKLIKE